MLSAMGEAQTIWLVAGGEPGAARFGQYVQRVRKSKGLSVEELAARTDLSVGTIRAVEQGRRAPSLASGARLLRVLLPEGSVRTDKTMDDQGIGVDCAFIDPETGRRILVEFRAKAPGDNRRWSSDKPPVDESQAEAIIRTLMAAKTRAEEERGKGQAFVEKFLSDYGSVPLSALGSLPARTGARGVAAPGSAGDAALGRLLRRLAAADGARLERLEQLLDRWDAEEAASGTEQGVSPQVRRP